MKKYLLCTDSFEGEYYCEFSINKNTKGIS